MDTSILDQYLIEALTTDTSGASRVKNSSTTAQMSQSFMEFFQSFSQRQQQTIETFSLGTSNIDTLQPLGINQESTADWMEKVTSALGGFFNEDDQFEDNLQTTLNWFSTANNARERFMQEVDSLLGRNDEQVAQSLQRLFTSRQNIENSLASAGAQGSVYFSSISSLQYNSTFGSSNEQTVGNLSFSSLKINMSIREVTIRNAGVSYLQTVEGLSVDDFLQNKASMTRSARFNMSVASTFFGDISGSSSTSLKISAMIQLLDPLVLDMDGDGIDLRGIKDGVIFDLKGDGDEVRCGFVQGDDALLFMDRDGDGLCSDGLELFGDQRGDKNGFANLAKYDSNDDGVIDEDDIVYEALKVWSDSNGDGECQEDEVQSLSDAGVESISLGYRDTAVEDSGNIISQKAFFRRFDGAMRSIVDAQFRYQDD